ncbi:MAG: tetratricopeptide repeat protein [Cyclobacteriaceae bacterium]|nr:tetratricopeptide repeat protein [Cyclobacteriaceae bacterium]
MTTQRKLAAIMFTDIVGYTAMMQEEESSAMAAIVHHKETLLSTVKKHQGKVIEFYGDGCLSVFNSATDAVQCAVEIQENLRKDPKVPLRIGIHVGEILIQNKTIFGDGVNLASRIESLGKAGTIFFSENVFEKIRNNPEFTIKSLGAFEFKNVKQPMKVFAIANEGFPVPKSSEISGKLRSSPRSRIFTADSKFKRSFIYSIAAMLILAIIIYYLVKPDQNHSENTPMKKSIAVLPFNFYSSMPDQQFYADGIADELRSQLLKIDNLKVIAQTSSRYYKDKHTSLRQIGKDLNVQYVLEGNVQRAEDFIKVNVQLSNTETEELEWASPAFNEKLEDVFLLQNNIAQQIVNQLKIELSDQDKNILSRVPTRNSKAYICYQKGQSLIYKGGGRIHELDEAVNLYHEAIELDPDFTLAYVGLAYAYLEYIFWGRGPAVEFLQKSLNAAFKALEQDEENAAIYGALGAINFCRFEKETAKSYLTKAIELSPNYLSPYEFLAFVYVSEENVEETMKLLRKALELDPHSTRFIGVIGQVLYNLGKYDEGLDYITQALEQYPEDNYFLWLQGCMYSELKKYDEAITTFQKRSAGRETNWMLGYAYGRAGNRSEAEKILNYQMEKREQEHVPALMIATIYLGLDDREKAIEWLVLDWNEGGSGILFWGLLTDPKYDRLREEPRFQALISRIK